MIGKSSSKIGGPNLYLYTIDPKRGYELDRNNLCGESAIDIYREMKIIQSLNQRAKNKVISIVLSPAKEDSKNMTKAELRQLSREFLQGLGVDLENDQFISFVHTDKDHIHCHILLNRVRRNGQLINDQYIGRRSQEIAHALSKKYGLISARDKMKEKIQNERKASEKDPIFSAIKKRIFLKHKAVMERSPGTLNNYIRLMEEQGVIFNPFINKQGEIQGFRIIDSFSNLSFKASDVNRSLSLNQLIRAGLSIENSEFNFSQRMRSLASSVATEQEQAYTNENHFKDSDNFFKEIAENISETVDVFLTPNYTSNYDPFLYEKKKKKKGTNKRRK